MSWFKKFEKCYGLSLPAIGRWKVEFWFVMPNYKIPEHSHDNQDIKLVFLFGRYVMFRKRKRCNISGVTYLASLPYSFLKVFNIEAGYLHDFDVSSWPLVFMNIEHYKEGVKPTSASEDINFTIEKETYAKT